MKQTTIVVVVLAFLVIGSPSTRADSGNPFGFATNKHPLAYGYCKKVPKFLTHHEYRCSSAPRPHPDFESYTLQFVEGVGLCRIQAGSTNFQTEMGFNHAIEMLKSQIAVKYGLPTKDTKQGSENLPVRHLHWSPEAGFNGLGEVKAIELKAHESMEALLNNVTVSFSLVTSDTCQEEINRRGARSF